MKDGGLRVKESRILHRSGLFKSCLFLSFLWRIYRDLYFGNPGPIARTSSMGNRCVHRPPACLNQRVEGLGA